MGKIFKFNGEDFEVSEPKNCHIKVVGKGLTGYIKIHEATGTYRESVMGRSGTLAPAASLVLLRGRGRMGRTDWEEV